MRKTSARPRPRGLASNARPALNPGNISAKSKARAGMTGARIAVAPARISVGALISRPRPMRLMAPRQLNNSARNAGRTNARIVARSLKVASSNSSSASITAIRAAMTARAARAHQGKIVWPCRPCRAPIAPLRYSPR